VRSQNFSLRGHSLPFRLPFALKPCSTGTPQSLEGRRVESEGLSIPSSSCSYKNSSSIRRPTEHTEDSEALRGQSRSGQCEVGSDSARGSGSLWSERQSLSDQKESGTGLHPIRWALPHEIAVISPWKVPWRHLRQGSFSSSSVGLSRSFRQPEQRRESCSGSRCV
jgi:hypothetical protein